MTLLGKPVQRTKMTADERHEIFPKCECDYTTAQDKPGSGSRPNRKRCRVESMATHVCTREIGHIGSHHSHIARNRVYSEWAA